MQSLKKIHAWAQMLVSLSTQINIGKLSIFRGHVNMSCLIWKWIFCEYLPFVLVKGVVFSLCNIL